MKNLILTLMIALFFNLKASHAVWVEVQSISRPMITESNVTPEKELNKNGMGYISRAITNNITEPKAWIDLSDGIVKISFKHKGLMWDVGASSYPLAIILMDKNGKYLKHIITKEFIPKGVYERTTPGNLARAALDPDSRVGREGAKLIDSSGKENILEYSFSTKDLAFTKIVTIGYRVAYSQRTKEKRSDFTGGYNRVIEDWSNRKSHKKTNQKSKVKSINKKYSRFRNFLAPDRKCYPGIEFDKKSNNLKEALELNSICKIIKESKDVGLAVISCKKNGKETEFMWFRKLATCKESQNLLEAGKEKSPTINPKDYEYLYSLKTSKCNKVEGKTLADLKNALFETCKISKLDEHRISLQCLKSTGENFIAARDKKSCFRK